ncbi:MAG: type IX secretion system protein PorQ [Bacteroidetes bacterium]|nr:type IX secretion system protein PorQ [Bacteroidota bacterium]
MRNKTKLILLVFLLSFFVSNFQSFAQIGGSTTYQFLNLPNSARISALGGNALAIKDGDLSLALYNPSLLSKSMNNHLALSFVDYYSDINYGFASYSRTFKKLGVFDAGIQFASYGKFTEASETGDVLGTFKSSDYCLSFGWAKPLDSMFSIGANLKTIYSNYYQQYNSFGIAVDVAATYFNSKKNLSVSLIAKNIGRELHSYVHNNPEPLPFEVQLGVSKKLEHVPFRISVVVQHLEKWDLTYEDPNNPTLTVDPLTNEPIPEKKFSKFADKLGRHFVFGGEFAIMKSLFVRVGYNYQRRKELLVDSRKSTVGFSWGLGIKISKFQISYARAKYHLVGSPNTITVCTNLSDFISKK